MTDTEHRELASVLRNVQGKVALSSYHCDLMDELYSDWYIVGANAKMCHSVKSTRTEVLWMNYEPPKEIAWTHHQESSQSHSKEPTLT
jgi:DNA adenine methylase